MSKLKNWSLEWNAQSEPPPDPEKSKVPKIVQGVQNKIGCFKLGLMLFLGQFRQTAFWEKNSVQTNIILATPPSFANLRQGYLNWCAIRKGAQVPSFRNHADFCHIQTWMCSKNISYRNAKNFSNFFRSFLYERRSPLEFILILVPKAPKILKK